jgi:hypothetical protein
MCDPNHVSAFSNRPLNSAFLELSAYRTLAFDAVPILARREETWLGATFGIADLTESVARAITEIPYYLADFCHVEWISPAAAAVILGDAPDCVTFHDVIALDPEAVRDLATRLQDASLSELTQICFEGDFRVDLELARALAALPIDLYLAPRSNEKAFDAGCAKALSRHVGTSLVLDAFIAESPSRADSKNDQARANNPDHTYLYSDRFISELASNTAKRLNVWEPSSLGWIELTDNCRA